MFGFNLVLNPKIHVDLCLILIYDSINNQRTIGPVSLT